MVVAGIEASSHYPASVRTSSKSGSDCNGLCLQELTPLAWAPPAGVEMVGHYQMTSWEAKGCASDITKRGQTKRESRETQVMADIYEHLCHSTFEPPKNNWMRLCRLLEVP